MDKHAAEVITLALEQQKQQEEKTHQQETSPNGNTQDETILKNDPENAEDDGKKSSSLANKQPDISKSDTAKAIAQIQTLSGSGRNLLPRSAAHKSFAVDPTLNVGVGIVPDIVGPLIQRPEFTSTPNELGKSDCSRCKKEFDNEISGKSFKLCPHCRDLQRQRSRRWQQKTKLKDGACRRCGVEISPDQAKFVLCPPCRLSLRSRKASRYENGKCVHCSGINDSTEFKVCTRCRNNDKQRRKTLELKGCCNRCAQVLKDGDKNLKICTLCRSRKKKASKVNSQAAAAISQLAASTNQHVVHYQDQIARQLEANLFAQEQEQASVGQSSDS